MLFAPSNKNKTITIQISKIMKKFKLFLGAFLILIISACDGNDGPPGIDGLDGEPAPLPLVFEESLDFSFIDTDNIWVSDTISFDGVIDGDIFLVFISLGDNLFTPLPASIFDEFGEFQYIFDHDIDSVELQIIGDSDLSGLDAQSTQNLLTRVAIIPAELVSEFNPENLTSLDDIMSISGLTSDDIISLDN